MSVSFQDIGLGGLSHHIPMPPAPSPMVVPNDAERYRAMSKDERLPEKVRNALVRASEMPFAMEIRRHDPSRQSAVRRWYGMD